MIRTVQVNPNDWPVSTKAHKVSGETTLTLPTHRLPAYWEKNWGINIDFVLMSRIRYKENEIKMEVDSKPFVDHMCILLQL